MHRRKWKWNCTVCSNVAVFLHASTSCAFLDYLTFNLDVCSHCWQYGVDFPQCVSKYAFQTSTLIGWVVAMFTPLWFPPVWTKEWLFKLIFWLKCFLHWVHLYFLVPAWNKNCHKNIVRTMFRLFQNIVKNIVEQCFCQKHCLSIA